tara:strand:+ start:117 stop:518 length:402 start_codon:yes stop_codon:yes gene_type:complete
MKKFDYIKNLPLKEGSRVVMEYDDDYEVFFVRGDVLYSEDGNRPFLGLGECRSRYALLDVLPKLKDTTPSYTSGKWGDWIYDKGQYMGYLGPHLVEYNGGEYWRHAIPKTTTVTGTVEVSHDGEPDFTTWEAS